MIPMGQRGCILNTQAAAGWASLPTDLSPRPVLQLGLGCGDLYGGDRYNQSERLIRTALDLGVRYFDVARLYGNGSAEEVLGEVLRPVRSEAVIATKAGIVPWSMQLGRRAAYKAAVAARRLGLSRLVAEPPPPRELYGQFDPRQIARSLETSLKALRTDHIDLLLLHECTLGDAARPQTLELLEGLKRAGKIRRFGVATHFADTLQILERAPRVADTVQIASDILTPNVRRLPPAARAVVTHSSLKRALPELSGRLAADPDAAQRLAAVLGADVGDTAVLARLLMALAAQDNPNGVVLFSTSRPERIAGLFESPFEGEALRTARAQIERLLAARAQQPATA